MTKKRISTSFYVLVYALGILAALLAGNLISLNASQGHGDVMGLLYFYIMIVPLIQMFVIVVLLTFIYKVWKPLQDGHARISPAAAAWLLLIPIFQLYWVFRAIWGFAKDYNRFIERHGLELGRLSEKFYLTTSILISIKCAYLTVGTLQPLLFKEMTLLGSYSTYVLSFPVPILILITIVRSCRAINALPEPAHEEE